MIIMKNTIKIPLIIVGIFIVITVLMAAFKICPPQGPWSMPPWCEGGMQLPEIKMPGLPLISSEAEKINITDAIVVPTDVSKIDYPNFYKKPATANVTIENPYCAITKETVAYPVRYLGDHELPQVDGAPLPAGIIRIIGIKDVWGPDPNKGCFSINGWALMKEVYKKTLQRVKALGADKITFTNYVHFSNFKSAEIDGPDKAAVSEEDLKFVVTEAREQNLEIILYLNLAPGKETVFDIPNASWLSSLVHNWEPFVLRQAKIAEETGIYAIMLNHFDYQPSIKGFENTYQEEMLALLQKIRSVYSGKVLLMIDPVRLGADLGKLDTLLKQVDGFIYTPPADVLRDESDKTVSVSHFKTLFLNNLAGLGRDFGKYNKPIYLRILIQSSKEFPEKGWSEDTFCIARGSNPCYQKSLEVDFSAQTIAYEAMMEAIKQTHNKYFAVTGIDSYGYWFTDVILPNVSQPQIAQSVRNKPAESIIKEWFKK